MNRRLQKDCESSCEYILPDYLGDVKKLVSSVARVVPSGQFESDAELECAGIVSYDIVYLDSENKLSTASFSSDYDFSLKKGEDYLDSYVRSDVSSFAVRVTGPRRMIAKTNVKSDIVLMEKWEMKEEGSAFAERDSLEKITKSVNVESALKGTSGEREYAESLASLEGVSADEIEIITSSAYVRIKESTPVDDGVNIKGELIVNAIIRTPESSVFAIRREIPFDETVTISGASPDASAMSDAIVSSLNLGVNDGENSAQIVANLIVEFSSALFFNESKELTTDAYLKTKETAAEYENIKLSSIADAETKSECVNVKIPLSELSADGIKEILSLNQDFRALTLKTDDGRAHFEGEIAFSGVACEISEDGSDNIAALKFTAPIDINVNISCQNQENGRVFATISPAGCEWEIEGDNLNISVWYTISASSVLEENIRVLSVCEALSDYECERKLSRVSVYYPEDGETLFDVAKKFHTSVAAIASDNMIAEPTALGFPAKTGFKRLIIR